MFFFSLVLVVASNWPLAGQIGDPWWLRSWSYQYPQPWTSEGHVLIWEDRICFFSCEKRQSWSIYIYIWYILYILYIYIYMIYIYIFIYLFRYILIMREQKNAVVPFTSGLKHVCEFFLILGPLKENLTNEWNHPQPNKSGLECIAVDLQ